mgnify:CR=1 FL=1
MPLSNKGDSHLKDDCHLVADPAEKAMHDKMVSLVKRMLALRKQSPRTPQEQEMVRREIESTDRGIDKLVYELSPKGDDIWVE